ncbi:unnamed protein product [Mytilus coruscus]|uniref:Novel STAND NTPase 3 domain-containing protein n=1 Tax=Mytilus coruscus TaxID=42192 RepID=A0A6J8AAE5_MYTCO|nr:unnamed protein product [Mytilus coruscus]
MLEECKELKTKILELSSVPGNVRAQINQTLEKWQTDVGFFVETRAAKLVFECVQKNSCVTITASSGVGKTATLKYVTFNMRDEGYDILLVTNPQDIVKFYNPNQKTLFVIDDFCGTYSINQSYLNSWEPVIERVKELIKNKKTKIIVACRLQVYQDEKFESLSIFKTCVCNLLSDDFCLSRKEKLSIAELYLKAKASEIIQYRDAYDCFPLLCKLYNDNPELNIVDFFKNPFSVYKSEIDTLHNQGHYGKYCALVLCVMFNNMLKEEILTEEDDTAVLVIQKTCQACRLDSGTSPFFLLDELNSLENTFIRKEQGVYKTLHSKIFDFLVYYFGQKMIQYLIKYADNAVIMERFLIERNDYMDQYITIVPPKYHQMFIQRMIADWSNGVVQCVFNNINMKIPEFRQRFLRNVNELNSSIQRQLALTCDKNYKDTVLLQCSYLADIPFIRWCIYYGVDVNQCRFDDVSPLFASAGLGDEEVVKLLLAHNANINKCNAIGESPLYNACQNNLPEIVKLLLVNKADINKCNDNGSSPLCHACANNYIAIVKLLLDNKADINRCTVDAISPLHYACQNNHIEVVKLLLDNKADIAACSVDGVSPLIIACCNNHIEILKILLDNKADINKCMNDGRSPLYFACINNYIEIVKLLIDNNADIDLCDDKGESPLDVACLKNHIEIAKLLIENKEDINSCTDSRPTPLSVACWNNYIEVVNILLDNKADIDKCTVNGASALYVACLAGNVEVIKLLLDNKADINKCGNDGTSPLYIVCVNHNIEIVKLLLDNKADIDKGANDGLSPLFGACEDNHIEVVKVLLDYNVDIDKCNFRGESPLCIACQKNHNEIVKLFTPKQGKH